MYNTDNIRLNKKYKILTPTGFQSFDGVRKLNKNIYYDILLSNGKSIKCSDNHPFILNGHEIESNKLSIGSTIDGTNSDFVTIISISKKFTPIDLFDILEVNNGNIFNVDGIVSHNCDFTTSGNTVLQPETLTAYHKILKEPIEKRWAEQSLWLWEYPDYTKPYLVCADVARGDGKDKSAFHIIRLDTCEQVGEYRGVIDTKSYGNLLVGIANEYNKAILVVENNNIGWATLQQIIDLEYPNTFYSSADLTYVDVEKQLVGKINRMERNMTPGFTTTQKTRPLIISKLESYFQDNSFKLNSIRTWEELSTFIWNPSGKAEAMRGYNDDLVTSLGIGLWVRDTALRLQTECNELTKASLGSISRMSTEGVYTSRQDTAKKTWEMPLFSGGNKINKSLTSDSNDDNMEDLTKWL
jgi:hypothetical protein